MKSSFLFHLLLWFCLLSVSLFGRDFLDEDFNPAHWDTYVIVADDPRIEPAGAGTSKGTVTRESTGGNGGAYRRSFHEIVGGDIIITGGIRKLGSYSPLLEGPLESVSFKADVRQFSSRGSSGFQFVIRQNGVNYYRVPMESIFWDSWESFDSGVLRAGDFDTQHSVGIGDTVRDGNSPDFSARGAPMEFGYLFGNGVGGFGARVDNALGIDNFEVTTVSKPPAVLSAQVNRGSPQRSMIQGIGVVFDRDVSSLLESFHLKVRNIGTGQLVDLTGTSLFFDPIQNSATWMLEKDVSKLLPDGNYIAWVELDQLVSPLGRVKAQRAGVPLDDFTFSFHQLAGDSDGDRDVDFKDSWAIRNAWQKREGQEAYRSFFDFDLNATVVEADRLKVAPTYFTTLPEVPALHLFLRNDTGTSANDNITYLRDLGTGIVGGTLVTKLELSIDGGVYRDVTDARTAADRAILTSARLDSIAGAALAAGEHTVRMKALDASGATVAEDSITFVLEAGGNLAPYFTSNPVPGAVTRLSEQELPASLEDWTVVPYLLNDFGPPQWVLEDNKTAARQNFNVTASIFLSDFDSANSSIKGRWRVDTWSDDDFMGFVFGFQNDQQYYLFDWKQLDQDGHAGGIVGLARAGMSVKKVKAVKTLSDLWDSQGSQNVEVLYQNNIPWKHHTDYDFQLDFFPPSIVITVKEGDQVVSKIEVEDPTYSSGGFGFYNLSQEQLVYRGFSKTQFPEQTYTYQTSAFDPDGDPLTFSLVSGPAGLTVDAATGLVTWAPAPSQIGPHEVTIRADDGKGGNGDQTFTITIVDRDQPPTITLTTTADRLNLGEPYAVRVTGSDDVGIASVSLTLNGQPVSLDASGTYRGTGNAEGRLFFAGTVTDRSGQTATARAFVTVVDPSKPDPPGDGTIGGPGGPTGNGNDPAPLVQIASPNGTAGESLTDFTGTVRGNGGTLASWRLEYAPESAVDLSNLMAAGVVWVQVASGTTEKSGEALGSIVPVALIDQNYAFRLYAENTNGRGAFTSVIFNPLGGNAVPRLAFTAPVVNSEISYLTNIRATIDGNGGTLGSWILDYAPAAEVSVELLSDPAVKWTEISRGTTAKNDEPIGLFDPTLIRNDSYVLRLRAWNTNGRGYQLGGIYHVVSQAKLGNFRVEFVDLSIPLLGIPIQVKRIYDSLEASRFEDFGYGWSLALGDPDIRETVPDNGGDLFTATPFKVGTRVYLTTPEGKRVGFTFKLRNPQSSFFFTTWEPYFEADRGVYEKLSLGPDDHTRVSQTSNGSVVYPLLQFGFNPNDYLLTLQDGTVYHCNQHQGLLDITDKNGNKATFTESGISHSGGASISFVRDAEGRITGINAPNSVTIGYAYDAAGDLVTVTNQLGAKTGFSYLVNPAHYLEKISNPNDLAQGRFTQKIVYDASGRVKEVQDGDGKVFAQQSFSPGSFTGTRTDGRGNVTKLVYNDRGNLIREEKPEGGVTRYEYSDAANPDKETAIIDPRNYRTEFTYDVNGNKITEKDPMGVVTSYGHNALGKITSLVRRKSDGTLLTSESAGYDAAGNLTKLVNPFGDERLFTYDGARLIASSDFVGNLTLYDYTNGCPCGSPSKITFADGSMKLFEYNAYGQVTKVTDETGAVTTSVYDVMGRKIREIDHDGQATVFEYDGNSNMVKRTDRLGRIAKFEYNARNLLVREIKILTNDGNDTNDVIVEYEYDQDDRLAALIDPTGNRTKFDFDRDGRMSTRTDAAGKFSTVQYDLAGNTTAVVDRNGLKRSFLYDSRNLPTAERWHALNDSIVRTISIAYDDLGRRKSISDPDSAYAWTYDVASRIISETNAGTPLLPLVSFTYGYDKDGRRTSVLDNAGVSVTTTFDNRGRSSAFAWQGGGISPASVDLDRNGRGQMTAIKRHANASLSSLVSQTTFDQIAPQGWVKQIQHKNASGALYNAGTNFLYGYDREGQVTSQSSQGNSTTYSYDPTGQLTGANHTAAAYPDEFYNYDKSGNRTSSHLHASYTTGVANRLQTDGVFNYSYDNEGNTIAKTEIATGKVTEFRYDHRGRVTAVVQRASAGGTIISQQGFVFDALDRRIGIAADGTSTFISYLDENAWADYGAAGAAEKRYFFADWIDANLAGWTPLAGTAWYLLDKQGSIRSLANAGGSYENSLGYDSFGTKVTGGSGAASERYAFTGRENIGGGGIYFRARIYFSDLGHFASEDPLGYSAGSVNLSSFLFNSPVNFADPTGATTAVEYNSIARTTTNEFIRECFKAVSVDLVGKFAEAGVYMFLASNGLLYTGRSVDVSRRERQHARRLAQQGIEIVKDSFRVFHISPDVYRGQLKDVRKIEQGLINLIKDAVGGDGILNKRNEIKGGVSPCDGIMSLID